MFETHHEVVGGFASVQFDTDDSVYIHTGVDDIQDDCLSDSSTGTFFLREEAIPLVKWLIKHLNITPEELA